MFKSCYYPELMLPKRQPSNLLSDVLSLKEKRKKTWNFKTSSGRYRYFFSFVQLNHVIIHRMYKFGEMNDKANYFYFWKYKCSWFAFVRWVCSLIDVSHACKFFQIFFAKLDGDVFIFIACIQKRWKEWTEGQTEG